MEGGVVVKTRSTARCLVLRARSQVLRDVKNEGRPGYVYDNTRDCDNMSGEKHGIYTKMRPIYPSRQKSTGLRGRAGTNFAINRGEDGPRRAIRGRLAEATARKYYGKLGPHA